MNYRVRRRHERSFEVAPHVVATERVHFLRYDSNSPGWFFGRTENDVEGYFPSGWFDISEEERIAAARWAYDAMELTVEVGDRVEFLDAIAGWACVRAGDGRVGWVPEETIEPTAGVAVEPL